EGVPEREMAYPPVAVIEKSKDGKTPLRLPDDYLSRTGYRMPTEAEWEFACRAGTRTRNYFGSSEELLGHHAWYVANSSDRTWPVGQKRPNDLGLFDMHGSVLNWCGQRGGEYPPGTRLRPAQDEADGSEIADRPEYLLRGASFIFRASIVRSSCRLT